jgi:L-fuconolactonase
MAGVDAHQHFWSLARGDYGWLTPSLAQIYRDFTPADLAGLLASHDIDRTILVQAAPTAEETAFLLELAHRVAFIGGVVGWTDLAAPEAPDTIAELARDRALVGLRPMIHDIPDDGWIAHPRLSAALRAMAAHGLVFDALVRPRHLPHLLRMIECHPDLSIVIDHGAKPEIRDSLFEPWATHMRRVAGMPNTVCKLSGLVTEARPDWTVDTLQPYVDHLLDTFGPHRLLWGSDWPVVNLAGGYDRWREATYRLLSNLTQQEQHLILGGTADRVYRRN